MLETTAPHILVCGVDEAGRGPWAGPVVAAAVVFRGSAPSGLADSKKLTVRQRERLYDELMAEHHCSVGFASAQEVDELNVLQATFLAMQRAVEGLPVTPAEVWVDGNQKPRLLGIEPTRVHTLVKGDALMPVISAASVLAKVSRDRYMTEVALRHPGYGFEKHSGYGVPRHIEALKLHGVCPEHRRTYAPIRAILQGS